MAKRLSILIALALAMVRIKCAPLTDDEADCIAEPTARMIHGKKKVQAAIHRGTDPFLVASAMGAIVWARLHGTVATMAPVEAAAPRRDASASAAQQQQPTPTSMGTAAAEPATAAGDGGGSRQTPLDQVDLSKISVTAETAQSVLDDLYADMRSSGRA